jgi:lipoprotein NlpI
VIHWLLGNHIQAIEIWKNATDTKYTDAAGGVEIPLLLFFASVFCSDGKLKEQSISKLEDYIDNIWPGPIAAFVLGKISEEELWSKMSQQSILKAKQICQASFYMAIVQYELGNKKGFVKYLQQACGQGTVTLMKHEYFLARNLLDR